jgi:hypothetical protein
MSSVLAALEEVTTTRRTTACVVLADFLQQFWPSTFGEFSEPQ